MKVELFPFQKTALARLRQSVATALGNYRSTHTPQVVSYTAPTGAGKTIVMSALIEDIYYGDELYPEQPEAIFIWLSDSPQLNEQSRLKIDLKADKIRLNQCVVISDDSFDMEVLEDGHIYFLNTQKLSKSSNLTKHSDGRQYTIWETLSNTVREKGDRLYFIIDEAHRGAQSVRDLTKNTTIMQKFLKGSEADRLPPMPVVIGMTATLINGYSSGIFHLLYRTSAQLMLADGKPHEKPALFNTEYGVVETTYTEADESYAAKRRSQKSGVRTRQLPGVSPLVFSRFLLEKTAFLSLSDMGKALPSYEEIPIACRMDEAVQSEYKRIENALVRVLRSDRRAAQKILSAYLNLLTVYLDQPYDQKPILYPDSDVPIVEPENIGDADTLGEKEQRTLEIVRAAIQNGERALIYTSWVRTDSQQKLKKLLTDEGYRTEILTDKIKTTDREDWVQKKLAAGMQVLIVNPSLVETGLDLNAFTTLVFYSMGYKLFTLRQASRRSWRINQKAPAVKVYMLYYEDTMQQKCLKLMASKLAVAGLIEGNFSEEGLAAMSDVQDMTSQMAKELMLGIRDNVEDIAAAFKKMAFENTDREVPEGPAKEAALPLPAMIEQPKRVFTAEQEEKLQAAMVQLEQQKAKRTKKTQQVENQLSLFDSVA